MTNIHFASQFQRIQSTVDELCCFWACGKVAHHDKEVFDLMIVGKEEKGRGKARVQTRASPMYPSEGMCQLRCLTCSPVAKGYMSLSRLMPQLLNAALRCNNPAFLCLYSSID